jgi:hypothetical protein
MKKLSILVALLFQFVIAHSLFAQGLPPMDPEAMKVIQSYQEQNENIPPEILGLMPSDLKVTEKKWSVETSSKMLLQLNLACTIGSIRLENTEDYSLDLWIRMTTYNLKSDLGKMIADQSLDTQRQQVQSTWFDNHQESQDDILTISKPEKIEVPHGAIYIQKIYARAHLEGEGMVPEKTSYCGFLYMDMEAGYLTAEVQTLPNTKTGIEKWFKHIAASAAKLKMEKYFE